MKPAIAISVCLVAVCAALANAGPQVAGTATLTPTVDQLVDRYVAAIGGRAALEKLTSRETAGTFANDALGLDAPIHSYAKAPNQFVQVTGANGEASQGFNGSTGWSMNVTEAGFRELQGIALATAKRNAEFYWELKLRELYPSMTTRGTSKVADRDAWVVDATPSGGSPERFFFDAQSGLLVRREAQGPQGRTLRTDLGDYRDVNGVKVPFKIARTLMDQTIVITLSEVKHNVAIDASTFEIPRGR
jgi:hypothetical protein